MKNQLKKAALGLVVVASAALAVGWGPAAYSIVGSTVTPNTSRCVDRFNRSLFMARASYEENNCAPLIRASVTGLGMVNALVGLDNTALTDTPDLPQQNQCMGDEELAGLGTVFDTWDGAGIAGIPSAAGVSIGVCNSHAYCDTTMEGGTCVPLNRPTVGGVAILNYNPISVQAGIWGSPCGVASGFETSACGQGTYCVAKGTLPFADWAPLPDLARASAIRAEVQGNFFTAAEVAALPGECHPTIAPGEICDGEWVDVMGDGTLAGASRVHSIALACHPGLVCDRTFAGPSGQGTCRFDADGPLTGCMVDTDCAPNQFCQTDVAADSTQPGVCVRRQAEEEFCDRNEDCAAGLSCIPESPTSPSSICCPGSSTSTCDDVNPCCGQQACIGTTTGGPFQPGVDDTGVCTECSEAGVDPGAGGTCCPGLERRVDYETPGSPSLCRPVCADEGAVETSPGFYDFECGGTGDTRPHVCNADGVLVAVGRIDEVCGDGDGDGSLDDDCDGRVDETDNGNIVGEPVGVRTVGGAGLPAGCNPTRSVFTNILRCGTGGAAPAAPDYWCRGTTNGVGPGRDGAFTTIEVIDASGTVRTTASGRWANPSIPEPDEWDLFGSRAETWCLRPGRDGLCVDQASISCGAGELLSNESARPHEYVCEGLSSVCDFGGTFSDMCFYPEAYRVAP